MFRFALATAIAGVVGLGALPAAAAAQTPAPPTLAGESFSASQSVTTAPYPFFLVCGNGPTSGPNFKFSGKATGPFAGTFTESGMVSYTATVLPPPEVFAPLTAYSAAFKIKSKQGTVTGSETLVDNGAMADCLAGAGGGGVNIGPVETSYTATIKTASGSSYADHGTTDAAISQSFGLGQFWFASLSDAFTSAPAFTGPPTIGGNPTEGQTLTESQGNWNGSPTSFSYQWQRCDTTGNNCSDIGGADSPTYTLTSLDVGSTIRVEEWATNGGGTTGPDTSAVTSVIQASASPPPPPPTPPSPPTPPLGGSPPPSIVTAPGAAQLQGELFKRLAPSGKAATISALLKRGGYTFSYRALTAGEIVISWYAMPSGAHVRKARAKPTLIATGRARFSAAGPVRITVKLTADGKRILKTAKRLRLVVQGAYTPAGGAAVSATRAVTLRR